jgi:dTDP-D-glucose 4,6-dehydratase
MNLTDTILVTGGAGFIGSNFVLQWIDILNESRLIAEVTAQ